MAEPISENSIRDLVDGIDRLVRSTERAVQAAGGTGKGGKVPSAVDEMLGTGFRDSLAKGIEKVFTGASRSAQKQATQQARAARDTSEGVKKANEGVAKSAEGVGSVFGKMAKSSGELSDALMGTGKAALELTKKLHAGATAASDYVGVTTAAVNGVSASLLRLGPKGIVMGAALKGVHMLGEASLAQADAQFAAYKQLQQFGGATSGGITDVLNLSQALNIGQKELGKFTALIQANASSLAGFRGSVGDGAKDLANISKDLTDAGFRDKFLRLGITIDEQNESTAYYIGLQTRLGRAQNMSVAQLAAGVAEYVQEQDKLTKATGITRKEQEAAQDRAMAQETFRAKIMELEASNQQERANELKLLMKSLGRFGPEIQADLAALATGVITTEGAARLQALGNMGGGDVAGIMQDAAAGNISAAEATEKLVETLNKATQVGSTGFGAAEVGAFDKTFGRSFGDLRNAIEEMTGFVARVAKVDVVTKEQAEDKGDAARLAAIEAAGLDMRKNTEAFTQIAVPAATTAIRGLAETAKLATDALGGIANLTGQTTGGGSKPPAPAAGGGRRLSYDQGGIASGPKSGYAAELHGTEAVVPLPDGKTIPVSIQGGMGSSGGMDPGIIEKSNNELDTFAKSISDFVSKLSKDVSTNISVDPEAIERTNTELGTFTGFVSKLSKDVSTNISVDPEAIERTNTELDTFTGFVSKLSKDVSTNISVDPKLIEQTNTELGTFTGFVSKLSKDFAHILRSQSDDISKGPAFGRDDKQLSLEEKSATALIQIKDLLSEAAGIEAPTWMFGGGGAGQRGGATGGFSGGGATGGFSGGGAGGGSPVSSMGSGSGIGAGSTPSMPSMGGGSGISAGGGARAGGMGGPSGESEEEGSLGSGLTASASDILNFTARSGSANAFEGLNSRLKESVMAAAEEYNSVTGNKIQINSAFRDPADQQRLWDESIKAGRKGRTATGMPIAQPGRSSHEKGLAVDIQNYNDPAAVAAMNRQGLSQKVPSDPVHFSFGDGGIAKGPKTGFPATLHGTEAVVPLPDGKTIPVRMPGMDKITELLGNLPSLLSQSSATLPLSDGKDMPVRIPGMDTITQMFGSLPSLLSPMIQSVTKMSAPNLPMMSSPGAALSSIMSSIQPPGGANAPGQDANMTKVLEQLSGVLRDSQGSDQGSAQLLQQLVSLQRDQNASIVKLIQTSMA